MDEVNRFDWLAHIKPYFRQYFNVNESKERENPPSF
jgi:hypothetical protein